MALVKKIQSLQALTGKYSFFIIDVWGVLHNGGRTAFPAAIELLQYLSKKRECISVILSNSPRNRKDVERSLQSLGIKREYYNHLHTSGQEVQLLLKERKHSFFKELGKKAYVIGHSNLHTLAGDEETLDFLNADYLLATRVPKDNVDETIPLLDKAIEYKIPLVCANPDLVSSTVYGLKPCPGVFYEHYEKKKGKAIAIGKPNEEIFNRLFYTLKNKYANFTMANTLVIGDGLYTDILGANNNEIDSVLISSGIHADLFDFRALPNEMDSKDFYRITNQTRATPRYIAEYFE